MMSKHTHIILLVVSLVWIIGITNSAIAQSNWQLANKPPVPTGYTFLGYQPMSDEVIYSVAYAEVASPAGINYYTVQTNIILFRSDDRGNSWIQAGKFSANNGTWGWPTPHSYHVVDDSTLSVYGTLLPSTGQVSLAWATYFSHGHATGSSAEYYSGYDIYRYLSTSTDHFEFVAALAGAKQNAHIIRIDANNRWDTVFSGFSNSGNIYPSVDARFRSRNVGLITIDTTYNYFGNRFVFRTTNGGATWDGVQFMTPDSLKEFLSATVVPAGDSFWLAKYNYWNTNNEYRTLIEQSSDDGLTWQIDSSQPSGGEGDITTYDDSTVYFVSNSTTELDVTTNRGNSWQPVTFDLLSSPMEFAGDSIIYDNRGSDQLYSINYRNIQNGPIIKLSTPTLRLGLVGLHDTTHSQLSISNVGNEPLVVTILPLYDSLLSISSSGIDTIQAGRKVTLAVRLIRSAAFPLSDSLLIRSNISSRDTGVLLSWIDNAPALGVESKIDLADQLVGDTVRATFVLANVGYKPLLIDSIRTGVSSYSKVLDTLTIQPQEWPYLFPGDTMASHLYVASPGLNIEKVFIYSNDPIRPIDALILSANGISPMKNLVWSATNRSQSDTANELSLSLSPNNKGGALATIQDQNGSYAALFDTNGSAIWQERAGTLAVGLVDGSGNINIAASGTPSLGLQRFSPDGSTILWSILLNSNGCGQPYMASMPDGKIEVAASGFGYSTNNNEYIEWSQLFQGEVSNNGLWNYQRFTEGSITINERGGHVYLGEAATYGMIAGKNSDRYDLIYYEDTLGYDYQNDNEYAVAHLYVAKYGEWEDRFGFSTYVPTSICLDADGNIIVQTGNELSKLDTSGKILWSMNRPEYLVASDPQSNLYLTSSDTTLVKLSPNGNTIWSKKYFGWGDTLFSPVGITTDPSGNCYLMGNYSFAGKQSIVTLKYDPDGTCKWIERYKGTRDATGRQLALDKLGNLFVAGSVLNNNGKDDMLLLKYFAGADAVASVCSQAPALTPNILRVFPNPATDYVTITAPDSFRLPLTVTLYDILGRELLRDNMRTQAYGLPLGEERTGMYEVVINDAKGRTLRSKIAIVR